MKNKQNPNLVDYHAIENEQKVPVSVTITTSNNNDVWCFKNVMGERHSVSLNRKDKKGCAMYTISHKAEVEVLTDIDQPLLRGIGHPKVTIGPDFSLVLT